MVECGSKDLDSRWSRLFVIGGAIVGILTVLFYGGELSTTAGTLLSCGYVGWIRDKTVYCTSAKISPSGFVDISKLHYTLAEILLQDSALGIFEPHVVLLLYLPTGGAVREGAPATSSHKRYRRRGRTRRARFCSYYTLCGIL